MEDLCHDLAGRKITDKPVLTGSAKDTATGASYLRRDADGMPTPVGQQHNLDLAAVWEPQEVFDRAQAEIPLPGHMDRSKQLVLLCQPVSNGRGDPSEELKRRYCPAIELTPDAAT